MVVVILTPVVFLLTPRPANAQIGTAATCAISSVAAALGFTSGKAIATAIGKAVTAARVKLLATEVPSGGISPTLGEILNPGGVNAENLGTVFGKIYDNFKDTCLKQLAIEIAKIIIRQMRNMVLNWIQTGQFGGQATFVTNFEFDAKKTAENAARLFASELTGIDFCNYFPINPAVNLNFGFDLRAGLECNFQKPHSAYLASLENPSTIPYNERLLLFSPENDPLLVELGVQGALARRVKKKTEARERQVAAGSGYPGIEVCVNEVTVVQGGYFHEASGERCDVTAGVVPEGCRFQAPLTECKEYKTKTPGKFLSDLATEPIKSEFREAELIDEFGEAIAAIIDALVGKVVNEGLNKAFGSN
ncbi:MAG: hypothetical protein HY471_00835 [Candidatus Sungbacteria bacterium]|nr:hypothetical protein [Candidatus Sungbacteria bacterium]